MPASNFGGEEWLIWQPPSALAALVAKFGLLPHKAARSHNASLRQVWCCSDEVSNGSRDMKLGRLLERGSRLSILSCLRNSLLCLRKHPIREPPECGAALAYEVHQL
jgi:hypothetical protein